jgi:hypothetical protein
MGALRRCRRQRRGDGRPRLSSLRMCLYVCVFFVCAPGWNSSTPHIDQRIRVAHRLEHTLTSGPNGTAVLYGGRKNDDGTGVAPITFADTWIYLQDDHIWQEQQVGAGGDRPDGRSGHTLIPAVPDRSSFFMYGGLTNDINGTWFRFFFARACVSLRPMEFGSRFTYTIALPRQLTRAILRSVGQVSLSRATCGSFQWILKARARGLMCMGIMTEKGKPGRPPERSTLQR